MPYRVMRCQSRRCFFFFLRYLRHAQLLHGAVARAACASCAERYRSGENEATAGESKEEVRRLNAAWRWRRSAAAVTACHCETYAIYIAEVA